MPPLTGWVGVTGLWVPLGQKNTPLTTVAGGLSAPDSAGKMTSSPALKGGEKLSQFRGLLQRAEFPLFVGMASPVQIATAGTERSSRVSNVRPARIGPVAP